MAEAEIKSEIKAKIKKIWISLPDIKDFNKLSKHQKDLLLHPNILGVILFANNASSKSGLKKFILDLKDFNNKLQISVDHEGGLIWRFNWVFRAPAAKYFGNLYKNNSRDACKQCYQATYLIGEDLHNLGVDVCFSPVVDIHDSKAIVIGNKLRAFSEDSKAIIDLGLAWVRGLNKAGVAASLKHFPGHGRCRLDSHISFPKDARDFASLKLDLDIYKKIISGLNNKLDKNKLDNSIMLGHMRVPALTNNNYSCVYSKRLIQDILGEYICYKGIIVSDCLSMRAADFDNNCDNNLKCAIDIGVKINKAWDAGCDWVIAANFKAKDLLEALKI